MFNSRLTKKNKDKQKINLILIILKGNQFSHFDYFGFSSVGWYLIIKMFNFVEK